MSRVRAESACAHSTQSVSVGLTRHVLTHWQRARTASGTGRYECTWGLIATARQRYLQASVAARNVCGVYQSRRGVGAGNSFHAELRRHRHG